MKSKPCEGENRAPTPGLPSAYYNLHSLLHTLRALESHIDDVCTLTAEIQRTGKVNATARRDIARLVHALPLNVLEADVSALHQAVEEAA
jgi:hypothetical protein